MLILVIELFNREKPERSHVLQIPPQTGPAVILPRHLASLSRAAGDVTASVVSAAEIRASNLVFSHLTPLSPAGPGRRWLGVRLLR